MQPTFFSIIKKHEYYLINQPVAFIMFLSQKVKENKLHFRSSNYFHKGGINSSGSKHL